MAFSGLFSPTHGPVSKLQRCRGRVSLLGWLPEKDSALGTWEKLPEVREMLRRNLFSSVWFEELQLLLCCTVETEETRLGMEE